MPDSWKNPIGIYILIKELDCFWFVWRCQAFHGNQTKQLVRSLLMCYSHYTINELLNFSSVSKLRFRYLLCCAHLLLWATNCILILTFLYLVVITCVPLATYRYMSNVHAFCLLGAHQFIVGRHYYYYGYMMHWSNL